ncbi:MAG: hypothetical protein LBU60_05745 [Clostridiales bacterium]|jgi:hypothetical protein|nr:hypothetical protein [Clostridiales bacterium]
MNRAKKQNIILATVSMVSMLVLVFSMTVFVGYTNIGRSIFGIDNVDKSRGPGIQGVAPSAGWNDAWDARMENTLPFAGGDGSAEHPYLIDTPGALARMAHSINRYNYGYQNEAHYKVTANLDMGARRWSPIGVMLDWSLKLPSQQGGEYNSSLTLSRAFAGTFDGGGFIISNLMSYENLNGSPVHDWYNWRSPQNDWKPKREDLKFGPGSTGGMFGVISGDVTIKNVVLQNATVEVANSAYLSTEYREGIALSVYREDAKMSIGVLVGSNSKVTDEYLHSTHTNLTVSNITINSATILVPEYVNLVSYRIGGIIGNMSNNLFFNKNTINIDNVKMKNVMVSLNASTVWRHLERDWYHDFLKYEDEINSGIMGGFVGFIDSDTSLSIKDSSIAGSTIENNARHLDGYTGGVIGKSYSNDVSIEGVHVMTSRISGSGASEVYIGGVAGFVENISSVMKDVSVDANIKVKTLADKNSGANIGGVLGLVRKGVEFEDVLYSGSIGVVDPTSFSDIRVGGMIGKADSGGKIRNKDVEGQATVSVYLEVEGGRNINFGGMVGYFDQEVEYGDNKFEIDTALLTGDIIVSEPLAGLGAERKIEYGAVFGVEGFSDITVRDIQSYMTGVKDYLFANGVNGGATIVNSKQTEPVAPRITKQPAEAVQAILDETVSVSVTAESSGATGELQYQWREIRQNQDGTYTDLPIPQQNKSSMKLEAVVPGVFQVYVEVSGTYPDFVRPMTVSSNVVNIFSMTVEEAASMIVSSPVSVGIQYGDRAPNVLRVLAQSNSILTYQWYRSLDGTNERGELLEGETRSVLPLESFKSGQYYAVVTSHFYGSELDIKSEVASVNILGAPTALSNFAFKTLPWIALTLAAASLMALAVIVMKLSVDKTKRLEALAIIGMGKTDSGSAKVDGSGRVESVVVANDPLTDANQKNTMVKANLLTGVKKANVNVEGKSLIKSEVRKK